MICTPSESCFGDLIEQSGYLVCSLSFLAFVCLCCICSYKIYLETEMKKKDGKYLQFGPNLEV